MKEGWQIKKLGEVCEFRNGAAHEQFIDDDGEFVLVNSKFISADGEKFKRTNFQFAPLYINEIAFVMSDVPNGKALAKCFLVDKNDTYTLNQRIGAIKSNLFLPEFLIYQFNRNKYLLSFNNGENQTNLRKGDILQCPLLVPSFEEQQRIVAILDEAFAAIAKAKSNAEQNLKNAKELFESYLQGVFENKGEGWETEKLVNLCNLITCGVASTPTYVDESIGIPFLSAQNVRDGEVVLEKYKHISVEFHKELTKKNKPQKGDILYSRVGAKFGEAGVVEHDFEFSVYVSLTLIKPKIEKINNYFLKYLLNSPSIKELANKSIGSSGVPNLNVKDVREFLISYPSLSIQKQIVKEIATMRAETQRLEAVYQQKLADLEELKKSILQKAFAGELTDKSIAS
uniref:restriction endonuclease subunit S n=1 Tax=Algoriphagus sp. TaxID=1872435 RepID=UPI0040484583